MKKDGDFTDGDAYREYAAFEAARQNAGRGNGGGTASGGLDPSRFSAHNSKRTYFLQKAALDCRGPRLRNV